MSLGFSIHVVCKLITQTSTCSLLTFPADQDPLSEGNVALFVKIDQSLLATEVQNPKIVLHPPRQEMIVQRLMKAVHTREDTHLLGMVGMGLTTVTALEERVEALLAQ